ncbi:MAG: zinc ABC transporter substrate-binding protein [Alistipes sp.]|nr:zinc ABC transporter substrate-binding protein [Alistipes sp.]
MLRVVAFFLFSALCASCNMTESSKQDATIYVSITPLKSIVEEITCGDFEVRILVPQGASPETFEPTAKQIAELSDSHLLFQTGLIDFEQSLVGRVAEQTKVVNLCEGVELMAGSCSHHHHSHGHAHGIDPHIWTSPKALMTMVDNVRDCIMREYPDSTKYDVAADKLQQRIAELDRYCASRIDDAALRVMMIYHPAYTYYARDYGIEQIAIEHDGKEPSPRQLTTLVERAKSNGIGAILLQPQYSEDKVRSIAEECGAEIVVTDPLCEDIIAEIARITDIICR